LLFVTPTHQFPTTTNLSASRRQKLLDIARQYKVPIIEDDYDHDFHYVASPPPPLAAQDLSGQVIYLSTFSKLVFPSARLAFMAVVPELYDAVCQFRRLSTHQTNYVFQEAMAQWMKTGGLAKHRRKMRTTYQERLNAIDLALQDVQKKHDKISWQRPSGGMALWLNLNRDASTFAKLAAKNGIFLNPESDYRLNKGSSTHVRLGFSNQNESELRRGIKALADLL
jgi:GntR family transcriptional regulator/MocR family aminotransferase